MAYIKGSMIIYEDDDVYAVATGMLRPSSNVKTGPMTQTFILNKKGKVSNKTKGAGCKGCPVFEGCYVRWEQAPLSVSKAKKAKRYKTMEWNWNDLSLLARYPLRIGSAGDPTAVPAYEWEQMLPYVDSWTGYTHKWAVPENLSFRVFAMASVHTVDDMKKANKLGFRTYRVGGGPITKDEVMCPHYTHNVQCAKCKLCSGASTKAKNIYAPAHGARKNKIK